MGLQIASRKAHHDLRPTNHGDRLSCPQIRETEQLGHNTDMTAPILIRGIHCGQQLRVRLRGPGGQFFSEEQLLRAPRTVEDDQPSEFSAVSQNTIDGWP